MKPLVVSLRPRLLPAHDCRRNSERTIKSLGVDFLTLHAELAGGAQADARVAQAQGRLLLALPHRDLRLPDADGGQVQGAAHLLGRAEREYTSYYSYDELEEVDERRFNRFVNLGITAEDMVGMIDGRRRCATSSPFALSAARRSCEASAYRSICLGTYIPWDVQGAGRAHQARARLAGRRGRGRAGPATTTRRSSAPCRACATTSSS